MILHEQPSSAAASAGSMDVVLLAPATPSVPLTLPVLLPPVPPVPGSRGGSNGSCRSGGSPSICIMYATSWSISSADRMLTKPCRSSGFLLVMTSRSVFHDVAGEEWKISDIGEEIEHHRTSPCAPMAAAVGIAPGHQLNVGSQSEP